MKISTRNSCRNNKTIGTTVTGKRLTYPMPPSNILLRPKQKQPGKLIMTTKIKNQTTIKNQMKEKNERQ